MRLIFLTNTAGLGLAYFQEQITEIPEELAEKFIRRKIAAPAPEKFTPLPKDFPYRTDFIERGLFSMEMLEKLPAVHSLDNSGNAYGRFYPKTKTLLESYRKKPTQKKPKNIIY